MYVKLGGPPCRYVGHPLIERIAELRPNAEEAQRRRADPPVVLVLPGSRGSEIRHLLGSFGAAIEQVAARSGPMELVLPTVPHLAAQVREAVAGWKVVPRVVVDPAEKWAAFRRARAALAASGTVTLELALAGIPTVAAYRMSPVEAFIVVWLLRLLVTAAERHPGQSGPRRERHSGILAVRLHAGTPRRGAAAASLRHPAAATPDRGLRPARCHHGHRRRGAERQGRGGRPRRGPTPADATGGAERVVTAVLTAGLMPPYHCGGHPAKAAIGRPLSGATAKNPA